MTFPLLAGDAGREQPFADVAAADLPPVDHRVLDSRLLLSEYRPTGKTSRVPHRRVPEQPVPLAPMRLERGRPDTESSASAAPREASRLTSDADAKA